MRVLVKDTDDNILFNKEDIEFDSAHINFSIGYYNYFDALYDKVNKIEIIVDKKVYCDMIDLTETKEAIIG